MGTVKIDESQATTGTRSIEVDSVGGAEYQYVKLVDGTAGSTAFIPGDATNGLWVNVKALSGALTLGAGSAVIGHVIADTGSTTAVTALPALPAGTNVIGHVVNDASSAVIGHVVMDTGSTTAVTSLPVLPAGTNVIGHVIVDSGAITITPSGTQTVSGTVTLGAGSAVVGHVVNDAGVASIGTVGLNTGSNVIGHVINDASSAVIGHVINDTGSTTAVTALPAIPTGANTIGNVGIVAGSAVIGHVINDASSAVIGHVIADTGSTTAVTSLPAIPTGSNVIGHVINDSGSTTAVTSLPALPAGTNSIGNVNADVVVTGSLSATGQVPTGTLVGVGTIGIVTTGTFSLTYLFEATVDGSTWAAVAAFNTTTNAYQATVVGAGTATFLFPCAGFAGFRVRVSAYTSGTLTVTLRSSPGAPSILLGSPLLASGNTIGSVLTLGTVTPGTAATSLGKAEDAASVSGDTGVFAMGIREDTPGADASYTNANGDYSQVTTTKKGELYTTPAQGGATLTNVAGSATSVNLLAANSNRRGLFIYNDSTALLYVKFGTTASTTSFTVQIPGTASVGLNYWSPPDSFMYVGAIDGIWASAAGTARITELATT